MPEIYDVIIVGSGPAGCVLATRLSEDAHRRVLLIEAGPNYGPTPDGWPEELLDSTSIPRESHPWNYSYARPGGHEPLVVPRARVVGGSAAINAAMWIRGSHADYDHWADQGNPGWSARDLLPYFMRVESDPLAAESNLHGDRGPVPVFRIRDEEQTDLERALFETAEELGYARLSDMNGSTIQRPSIGPTPRNIANGIRMNPALTYLASASARPNLSIMSDTLVDRILVKDRRATAVQTADGQTFAAREIVLTAGSYNSPAILLRSGIGPADQLRELKIACAHHLPGVGAHLMDHPMTGIGLCEYALAPDVIPKPVVRCFLKARSQQVADEIDLHIYWYERYDSDLETWILDFRATLMYSRSLGSVRLQSANPVDPPVIDFNYLAEPADLEALCDGLDVARRLAETPPVSNLLTRIPNGPGWSSRDELRELIPRTIATTHHPSSTCRMGPSRDPLAVVDHAGRVHGIDSLRIADASIFPYSPRANLHFTICAAAEKIADMMR